MSAELFGRQQKSEKALVFREMWETAALHGPLSQVGENVKVRGLPHLAKNQRDMGHPTILGREKGMTVFWLVLTKTSRTFTGLVRQS